MKKIRVITDSHGEIVSISEHGDVGGHGPSGIARAGIVLGEGQQEHEIDLPDDLANASLLDLHQECEVKKDKGKAQLVRKGKSS